jgi:uncharacterized membrane protein
MLTLIGVAIVVAGFLARLNPLLVVVAAALATGLAAGMTPVAVVSAFGRAFNENRYVSIIWLVLPVIGLLERAGLQVRARQLIGRVRAATTGRLLLTYLAIRQITAALGLVSLGGHAQMVRPLIAPMAEGAAEIRFGVLPDDERNLVRAYAAATDNVGVFFGEDIFIAIGSIAIITAFLAQSGIVVEPIHLSLWAIPSALLAFAVHGARLLLLDRRLKRRLQAAPAEPDDAA